jgi:predicted negative regulator of RcsB-dependent stress response
MQEYETEEQQIEAIKKWWKENSSSLFIGLALGLGAIFGWQYYGEYNTTHSQQASDLYNVINQQVKAGELTDINKLEQLTTEYTDTPYAVLAALTAASYYYDKGNVDEAIKQLQWAEANSSIEENKHLARIRLATVYISAEKYAQAEAVLSQDYPTAFAARYEELKGDLYVAKGDRQLAIQAYDRAIASQQGLPTPWLQMKRNDLGEAGLASEPVS